MVAPDDDGLLPKRPVGCVNTAGAVGGAPKPPKAGVALEAKMLGGLVLLDGAGFAKMLLELLGLLNGAKKPVGAKRPELLVLLDGA